MRTLVLTALCGLVLLAFNPAQGELYFPPNAATWETIDPTTAGFDPDKLQAAIDYAGEQNSSALVILYNGRLVAEQYWSMDDASPRYKRMRTGTTDAGHPVEDVASAQKSIVAFLIAQARDKDLIVKTQRIRNFLDVGWSAAHQDREGDVTVHHLMSMTSGLNPRLSNQAAAGSFWRYNTNAYSKLIPVLEDATGANIKALTRDWLTVPIGMTDSSWTERTWLSPGQDANRIGFSTSARDLARFGLLVQNNGMWSSQSLIDNTAYLKETIEPSQKLNPAYGYLWWINGQDFFVASSGTKTDGPLIPEAPGDLIAAQGALGRKCYIVPSQGLVVTRLGDTPEAAFNNEFWKRLSAALSD